MVAFTPNLSFPYAQPTDPADVPLRLEEFAEAVDSSLGALEDRARPRAMAQFLGTVTNTIPGTATSGTFTWQLTDYNTEPFFPGNTPALVPVTDASTTQLTVNWPGFWYVSSSVQIASMGTGSGVDMIGIDILVNGLSSPFNARSVTHDVVFAADGTHVLDVSTGLLLAAGDRVSVRGVVGRSSGSAAVRFERRSITLLRMTQS
jgi:hypothetical protein